MSTFKKPTCCELMLISSIAIVVMIALGFFSNMLYKVSHSQMSNAEVTFNIALFFLVINSAKSFIVGHIYLSGLGTNLIRRKMLIWYTTIASFGNVFLVNIAIATYTQKPFCHYSFSWWSLIFLLPLFFCVTKKWLPSGEGTSLPQVITTFLISPYLLLLSLFTKAE